MTHETGPSPEEPEYPDKSIWDVNPDVEHDPDISALDNIYKAYDGDPPKEAIEFGIYLDNLTDLIDRHRAGEITSDEFWQLQQNAHETMMPPENDK